MTQVGYEFQKVEGGSPVKMWTKGVDFENSTPEWYSESIEIDVSGIVDLKIRFWCNANGLHDYIYIDDVSIWRK